MSKDFIYQQKNEVCFKNVKYLIIDFGMKNQKKDKSPFLNLLYFQNLKELFLKNCDISLEYYQKMENYSSLEVIFVDYINFFWDKMD